MTEPENKRWWRRRAFRIVGSFDIICVAVIVVIMMIPALAATTIHVPGTDYVIDLGQVPPWIMAIAVVINTWMLVSVHRKTSNVSTQIDGLLVARDASKVAEGEKKGERAGVRAAEQLAEGQRRGIEIERASAAAKSATPSADQAAAVKGNPLPVADDRTGAASDRVAQATERLATATEVTVEKKLADK